jgi:hypothetical protein
LIAQEGPELNDALEVHDADVRPHRRHDAVVRHYDYYEAELYPLAQARVDG